MKECDRYSALLVGSEVGIGALMHAWHLPGTGQLLSLNQCFLLSRVTHLTEDRWAAARVSRSAALLKALSPYGKRVTPMLAIGMQGLLFSTGLLLAGTGRGGRILGAILLSLWAYVQPLLLYGWIYRDLLIEMAAWVDHYVPVWGLVIAVVGLKVTCAATIALAAPYISLKWHEKQKRKVQRRQKGQSIWKGLLKDLLSPTFLGSVAIASILLYVRSENIDGMILPLLKIFGCATLAFWLMRTVPIERLIRLAGTSRAPLKEQKTTAPDTAN